MILSHSLALFVICAGLTGCDEGAKEYAHQFAGSSDPCEQHIAEVESKEPIASRVRSMSEVELNVFRTRTFRNEPCGIRPAPPLSDEELDMSPEEQSYFGEAVAYAMQADRNAMCQDEVKRETAEALEALCLRSSGATHPRCSAAQSTCRELLWELSLLCIDGFAERIPRMCSLDQGSEVLFYEGK